MGSLLQPYVHMHGSSHIPYGGSPPQKVRCFFRLRFCSLTFVGTNQRLAHTPAGCGHGGTRQSNTSRTITTEYPSQANRISNRYSRGDRSNASVVWPHLPPPWDHDQATSGTCLCRVALPRSRTHYSLRCHEPREVPRNTFPVPTLS